MLHGVYVVFVGYTYLDDLMCTYITSLGILVLKKCECQHIPRNTRLSFISGTFNIDRGTQSVIREDALTNGYHVS